MNSRAIRYFRVCDACSAHDDTLGAFVCKPCGVLVCCHKAVMCRGSEPSHVAHAVHQGTCCRCRPEPKKTAPAGGINPGLLPANAVDRCEHCGGYSGVGDLTCDLCCNAFACESCSASASARMCRKKSTCRMCERSVCDSCTLPCPDGPPMCADCRKFI